MFCEFEVNKNLSGASAVCGVFTMGKPKPDRDCWHVHFHCETAVAQHEVGTKSATHVTLIRGQPCSVAVALKEIGDPRSLWDQTTAMFCNSGC